MQTANDAASAIAAASIDRRRNGASGSATPTRRSARKRKSDEEQSEEQQPVGRPDRGIPETGCRTARRGEAELRMPPMITIASNSPEKAIDVGSAEAKRWWNANTAGKSGERRGQYVRDLLERKVG
jgi:hypothetical protein